MRTGKPLRSRIIDALSRCPIDYIEQSSFIEKEKDSSPPWAGAGVLMILQFPPRDRGQEDAFVLLNKRSEKVRQAGDLCFPGGRPSSVLDPLLRRLLEVGVFPLSRGEAFCLAKKRRERSLFRIISFYLTVGIREAWEEMRLNPFSIDFLGPLPSYRLEMFQRVLFPVVAEIRSPFQFKPNWEVERIFTIPLATFFDEQNYALYSIKVEGELQKKIGEDIWEFPCLVLNSEGKREILWGATFNVIISFLKAVFDFEPPQPTPDRRVWGELFSNYLYGSKQ
jgi:8-oxo-dGTP pyrophosphatase MutT (NUDIX family)